MKQSVIRNFKDYVADVTDNINFVNDFKQFKTILNNHWQNNGIYSTIDLASKTEAFARIYNNDGRFGQNKELGVFRAVMNTQDNKCDFYFNGRQVNLIEIENILNQYENGNFEHSRC